MGKSVISPPPNITIAKPAPGITQSPQEAAKTGKTLVTTSKVVAKTGATLGAKSIVVVKPTSAPAVPAGVVVPGTLAPAPARVSTSPVVPLVTQATISSMGGVSTPIPAVGVAKSASGSTPSGIVRRSLEEAKAYQNRAAELTALGQPEKAAQWNRKADIFLQRAATWAPAAEYTAPIYSTQGVLLEPQGKSSVARKKAQADKEAAIVASIEAGRTPSGAKVVERDAKGKPTVYEDKTGVKYYTPYSTMYKYGFRTSTESREAQRYGVRYGPHEGELVPAETLVLTTKAGEPYLRIKQEDAGLPVFEGMVRRGQYLISVQIPPGKEVLLTSNQLEQFSALKGEKQFNRAVELGIIPKGSIYIPQPAGADERGNKIPAGWTYIPPDVAAAIKSETPELYDVLTKEGYQAYQQAVEGTQKEYKEALQAYEEWQTKLKSGEIKAVGGDEYMPGNDYKNLPPKWKQYVDKYGVTALGKHVDSILEKLEPYKKIAWDPLQKDYVTYDVIKAIREGAVTIPAAKELFDLSDIEKRTKLASYTQLAKDFSKLADTECARVISAAGSVGPRTARGPAAVFDPLRYKKIQEKGALAFYSPEEQKEILEMYATTYGIGQKVGGETVAYPVVGKYLGQAYLHPKIAWKTPTEAEAAKGIVGMSTTGKVTAVALPVMIAASFGTGAAGAAGVATRVAYYGASGTMAGITGYSTAKNWDKLTPSQRAMGIGFTALFATPIILAIAKPSYTSTTPIKTSKGDIVIWKGFTLRGRPVIGVSFKHLAVGKYGVQYPSWVAEEVTPGWVPGVKGVDAHLLATKNALAKMGFGQVEITKIMSTVQATKLMTSWLVRIPKPQAEALLQSIKNLDEKELALVLKELAQAGKNVDKIYGSYSIRAVLSKALNREVADLDIQFLKDAAWTKNWVKGLAEELNKLNPGKFRIAAGRDTLIEALAADGTWHHALDIHCQGEVVPYTVTEGAYGMKFARNPITINVPGVGRLRLMALKESVVRKMASILEWKGGAEVGPPAHRFKDITDFYDMARFLLGENYANAWAIQSGLDPAKLAALADKNPAVATWVIDMSPSPGTVPTINLSPPVISAVALKELGIPSGASPAITQPLVAPPLQLVSPAVSPATVESQVSFFIAQMAPKLSPNVSSALSKAITKVVSPLVSKGVSSRKISTAISKTISPYVSKGVISPSISASISRSVSQAVSASVSAPLSAPLSVPPSPPPVSPPSVPLSVPPTPPSVPPSVPQPSPPSVPPFLPPSPPNKPRKWGQATVKNVVGSPNKPGIVSWRQGIVWVSVFPPYEVYQRHGKPAYRFLPFIKGQRVNVLYTPTPPPLARRYKGRPKETVYTWKGPPPEELTLDMGIVDVTVTKGKNIRFERVPTQVATKAPAKVVPAPRKIKFPEPEKLLYQETS